MSAILAVCGDGFCAMVSDGRFVEEPITGDTPHVIKNDLPKVRKINRNVVVGFAGDTLAAVQIINAVDEYQTQYLTLEKVVKILRDKAAEVQVQPVGVRLIVGGRNRKGEFVMTMLGSADGYEPQTQAARPGAYLIEGACSHTDVAPGSRRRSSLRLPTGAALTMWPAHWTAALPRWPRTTRASIPRISVSLSADIQR